MPLRKIGNVYYIDLYTPHGRIRKRASTKKAIAQRIHDELLGQRDLSRFGIAPDKYPLKDLRNKFLQELEPRVKEKTFHDYKVQLDMALAYLGETPLNTLRHKLNEYISTRAKEGKSAKIINRTIGLFKRMLSYGVQTNLLPFNPLAEIPFLKEKRPPQRALTREEIKALLAHSGRYKPIWLAFLTTGLRRSELVRLTWKDIDLKACTLTVRESKTDAGVRVIPLAPSLSRELQALRRKAKGDYVFTTETGTPLKNNLLRAFKACVKRARINPEGLNIHSLRHTFSTLLASKDVHPKKTQALLGHESALTSLDIYTRVFNKDLKRAIEKIDVGEM